MATITEDYVSFEIAKLLREKGFDEPCFAYYSEYFDNWKSFRLWRRSPIRSVPNKGYMNVPTLQMAMKWLREKYNLVIQIELIDFLEHGEVWLYCITERKTIKQLTGRDEDFTEHSYEQACEAAIKYCLENLI